MRALFLSPSSPASGNETTTQRIVSYLVPEQFEAIPVLNVTQDLEVGAPAVEEFVNRAGEVEVVFVLHALRAGRHLPGVLEILQKNGKTVRVVLIFGGTDVNVMPSDPEKLGIMKTAISLSHVCVCFSKDLRDKAVTAFAPDCPTHIIPQAARSAPIPDPSTANTHLNTILSTTGISDTAPIFLAPMGLRAVKDPLYIAEKFRSVHERHSACLLFIGPEIEASVATALNSVCSEGSGVYRHDAISQKDLHLLYCADRVCGVVNCSQQEGQPQAVMEGMLFGVPALMRDIPGNTAIATHNTTALFFTHDTFASSCERLLDDPSFARQMGLNGKDHMLANFSLESESTAYRSLVETILKGV